MKHALIVGSNGQDGRLLQQRLAEEGTTFVPLGRGDLAIDDGSAVADLVQKGPSEIYYLAAHHHSSQDAIGSCELDLVRKSTDVHVTGLACFLEAIRLCAAAPDDDAGAGESSSTTNLRFASRSSSFRKLSMPHSPSHAGRQKNSTSAISQQGWTGVTLPITSRR